MAGLNEINLVPPDIVDGHVIRQRIRRGGLFLSVLVAFLFVIGMCYFVSVKRLERRVADLRSQGRKVKRLEDELQVCLQGAKQLLEKREMFRKLTGRYCFTSMVTGLAQAMNPETKLNTLWVEKSLARQEQGDTAHGRQKEADIAYELRLWGMSRSYRTLSVFLSNLQNDRAFQGVVLVKPEVADEKKKSAVLFEISLRYGGIK
ncbi:MAG: PilN domain-containing protein [bacterium]